jgi:hypothetical protein
MEAFARLARPVPPRSVAKGRTSSQTRRVQPAASALRLREKSMNKTKKNQDASRADAERRSGRDRRQRDAGAPSGTRDRRTGIEPRRPEAVELDLTLSQWAALNDEFSQLYRTAAAMPRETGG